MNWRTIRNCGYLYAEGNFVDGTGMRNGRAFLNEISEVFPKLCTRYFDQVGELPFVFKERQINSIILPAIARVADAVLSEQPVERIYGDGKSYTGHIDYWVLYGTTVFLVELKHSWLSTRTLAMTEKADTKWKTAIEQINSITPDVAMNLAYGKLNPVKVALMVLPFYVSCNHDRKLELMGQEHGREIRDILKGLEPDGNFISIWNLHGRLQGPFIYENKKEIYPYLAMVARLEGVGKND